VSKLGRMTLSVYDIASILSLGSMGYYCRDKGEGLFVVYHLNLIQNTSTLKIFHEHSQYQNSLITLRQESQKYAEFDEIRVARKLKPSIVDNLRCIVIIFLFQKK